MTAPTISFTLAASNHVSPSGQYDEGAVTLGSDSRAVVVVVPSTGSAPLNGVRLGASWAAGVALTKVADSGASGRNCTVWWLDDLSGSSSGDHVWTDFNSGAYNAQATAYVLDHATLDLVLVDGDGTTAAGPGPVSVPALSGSATDALGIGGCSNNGFAAGSITLGPDLVNDNSFSFGFQRGIAFHDPTSPLTAHASHSDTSNIGIALAAFAPGALPDVDLAPTAIGIEVGFQSGVALALGEAVTLYPSAIGIEVGIRSGVVFGTGGSRQVMLTGAGIETPEMTTGGTEGYVLTYHEGAIPTWEPGSGPGSLALDDLSDVDAPTPGDGDVLTWDDGAGEWVAAPPAGGAMALDDLTDVNAPTPGDGDALVWDSGSSFWVPGTVGSSLEVKEVDGAPDVTPVSVIRVPNGTLTDDTGGQITLDYAASGHSHALDFGEVGDIAASAPGDTAAAGSSGEVADASHRHARESYATLTAGLSYGTTADMPASAPGDAESAGSSGKVSDAGHKHEREAKLVGSLNLIIDGGGSAIGTGIRLFGVLVDFPCTVTGWTILSDLNTTTTLDVWKDSYANHPPVVGDSMVGAGTKPSLGGVRKNQSTSPDWTTSTLAAGDIIFVNVDSNSAATWLCLSLRLRRDGSA